MTRPHLILFAISFYPGAAGCTPGQLAAAVPVVQTVAELAKEVCTAGDDPFACLRKCETEHARRTCECGIISADPLPPRCAPCDGGAP